MPKIKYSKQRESSKAIRQAFKFFYQNKFFNKWMNLLELEGLNYQQSEFIMRKFWFEGTIACSHPTNIPEGLKDAMKEDSIIFTPWCVDGIYNIYDYPIKALPINLRGVDFISRVPLLIDEEIIIGYCQKNHKSIYSSIEPKLNELVDIEMVKRVALKCQKMPWLFTASPENKTAIEQLVSDLESDEPTLMTTLLDSELGKGFVSGAPYILDKLEMQRQKIEDDINTILSVNNVGIAEKKEHLLNGEIDANNQSIKESGDDYLDMIQEFFDRVEEHLGYKVNVKLKHEPPKQFTMNEKKEPEEGENDE